MKIAKLFIVFLVININAFAQEVDYAELEWAKTFIGPDSNNSVSKGMALDKEGNIYVAVDDIATIDSGYSWDYVLIKYTNLGSEEWTTRFPTKATRSRIEEISTDESGNVYLAGSVDRFKNYKTLKYNYQGTLLWVATESASGFSSSIPIGLIIDDSNNVYMASQTGEVFKYNFNGEQIWNILKDGRHNYSMQIIGNNIYMNRSGALTKYNINGIKLWEVLDTLDYRIIKISNSSIYLSGEGLTKYNLEGKKQWSIFNLGYFMTVDNEGNPITFREYYNGIYDQFSVIKFDTNGVKLWEELIDYPSFYLFSESRDICTDRFNNIYISGYIVKEDGNSDIITAKFSPAGKQQWIMRYNGFPDASALDAPNVIIKVDSIGNVYITAVTVFRDVQEQVVTIKYRQPNFPVSVIQENIDKYSFQLFQNYPNPFNPSTNIKYSLQETGQVQIDIIDIQGQTIKRLVNEEKELGVYNAVWDGQTDKGYPAASGIYICRLLVKPGLSDISANVKSIKLLVLK